MVKFTFGLEACMTKQEHDDEKIYYMNNVYLKAGQPADDEAITRVHTEIIPFKCGYDKKAIISKVSFSPRATLVVTDAGNFSKLSFKSMLPRNIAWNNLLSLVISTHDAFEKIAYPSSMQDGCHIGT